MDAEGLKACDAEFLVLIKAYDDTFSQNVNLRFSYRYDEIVWGAKFKINFDQEINEKIVIEMNKMDDFELVQL
jgi:inward rectifier potassium channel